MLTTFFFSFGGTAWRWARRVLCVVAFASGFVVAGVAAETAPVAQVGRPYVLDFAVTGIPRSASSYTVAGLPPGLAVARAVFSPATNTYALNAAFGTITGTPAAAGVFPLTITGWELAEGAGVSQTYTASLTVSPGAATVTLENLGATYDGAGHPATATTVPRGLAVTCTYDGRATAPAEAGTYAVVGTISDPNYQGSTSGTLVIAPAPLLATAEDQARIPGVDNLPLTIRYTGFVPGETAAVLATPPTASTAATSTSAAGSYPITLTGGSDRNYTLTLRDGTLTVSALAAAIVDQPTARTTAAGVPTDFSVTATSALPLTYQWQVSTDGGATWTTLANGAGYAGADTDVLTVRQPTGALSGGWYRCVLDDGVNPAVATRVVRLTVPWSQLAALSARAPVGTGDQTLIMGFVFAGGGKPTLVRGVGPGLVKGDPNLAGQALADPQLTLHELQTVDHVARFVAIATNDNWGGTAELRTQMAALGMGALDDTSADAALLTTPTNTVYTTQISGVGQTTGLALAEVYDADFTDKTRRLAALSVRNHVGTGAAQLIVGFVVAGDAPKKVIVRGVGPGLVPALAESTVLANPTLQLNRFAPATQAGTGTPWTVVGANDDWGGVAELATAMNKAGMGALAADSKDAVLLIELQPGIYTAQVSGVGDTTGIGLVEVYEVP